MKGKNISKLTRVLFASDFIDSPSLLDKTKVLKLGYTIYFGYCSIWRNTLSYHTVTRMQKFILCTRIMLKFEIQNILKHTTL